MTTKAKAAPKFKHQDTFDPSCPVCCHDHKAVIEEKYIHGYTPKELENLTGIPEEAVRIHTRSNRLDLERANNTDAIIARMIEAGYENLDPADISPKLLISLLKHRDKLNGRVIDKVEQLRPTKVIILAPPQTYSLVEKAATESQKVIKGEVVRALGPGDGK